jgi:uncharacterized membrane protein YphA (DoxX/SURF4 family)
MAPRSPHSWTPVQRVTFRFCFCYFLLFFFPFPHGLVNPYWLGGLFDPIWRQLVPHVADFLGITIVPTSGGSGDTSYDYVRILVMAALSILATVIWSIVDHRRQDYRALHAWVRIWLRYALALCMLTFGAVKVVMLQFERPSYGRLIEPLGELSPMALLWLFMGFSPWYTSFTGVSEVIAGALLLFRRTTSLGALLVAGIMSNVLMLNVSYDVPVKLGAFHVLLAAVALLAPDMPRLWRFFVLNRPTEPADIGPHWTGATLGWSRWIKGCAIGAAIAYLSWDAYAAHTRQSAAREPEPVPPEGWYRVVSIKKDGEEVLPARADELRWKIVSVRRGKVGVRGLDGAVQRFRTEGTIPGPMTLFELDEKGEPGQDSLAVGVLRLQLSDGVAARLQGTYYGHEVEATLERQNPADFPLMSRRFRWVIEEPYFH